MEFVSSYKGNFNPLINLLVHFNLLRKNWSNLFDFILSMNLKNCQT